MLNWKILYVESPSENHFSIKEKIIKGKMNNTNLQISHQNLKTGTLIKLINPKNNESIVNTTNYMIVNIDKILTSRVYSFENNGKKPLPET